MSVIYEETNVFARGIIKMRIYLKTVAKVLEEGARKHD